MVRRTVSPCLVRNSISRSAPRQWPHPALQCRLPGGRMGSCVMAGVVIGQDMQTRQDITLGDVERCSGLYVLGKPGMGKSTLILNIITADLINKHGLFF